MGLEAAAAVGDPVLIQVEAGVEQGLAATADIGQEDTGLTVVDLAQAATPLAGHTTGGVPLLGEGGGVEDEDAVGVGQFLTDVTAEFVEDGAVVPAAGADEELQGTPLLAGGGGDG